MSKEPRTKFSKEHRGADCGEAVKDGSVPYSVAARRERSKTLAQKRRTTYKSIMDDLTQALPFPKDVVSQLDYNSRLRLSLCFFRLKTLLANGHMEPSETAGNAPLGNLNDNGAWPEPHQSTDVVQCQPFKLLQPGMLQSMMAEALDGFLLVASSEGTIVFLSESVHHHLGIFQSEHIGVNMYDIISEEDHKTVREAVTKAEAKAMSFNSKTRGAQLEFFCRMKCSRFKVVNTITKSPGFKVVFVSGSVKMMRGDTFLVTVVRPVSPPSILEIRMEANMFVTHYDMEMKCLFFDGRLRHLLGYKKTDLEGISPFHLHHHEDTAATAKCSVGIMSRGEGLSGYYRFLTQSGFYLWLQTRGTLMHDSRTGKPTYIVCLNYIISKEAGEKDLSIRQAITAGSSSLSEGASHSYDPPPITQRTDGSVVNPLPETSWHHKKDFDDFDINDFTVGEEKATIIKEETCSDSGIHLDSLTKNSGSLNSLSISSGSPCCSNPSSMGSLSSLNGSTTRNDPTSPNCLPDSTSELPDSCNPEDAVSVISSSSGKASSMFNIGDVHLASVGSAQGSSCVEYLGEERKMLAVQDQSFSGQAPSGQAVSAKVSLGQALPGQAPLEHADLSGQNFSGHTPPGQTSLGKGLPEWRYDDQTSETMPYWQPASTYQSEMPIKQEQNWINGQCSQSISSSLVGTRDINTSQNYNDNTALPQAEYGMPYVSNPGLYPQALMTQQYISPAPGNPPQCSYTLNATPPLNQVTIASVVNMERSQGFNMSATFPSNTATIDNPQPLAMYPSAHPSDKSQLHRLLGQQKPAQSPVQHNVPPLSAAAAWGGLPQLTGEDLEMLDIMAK